MAQPGNFVFIPYIPIALVYYNPQEDQPIQTPDQEEEFLDSQVDYNVELEKYLKREEEAMKQAYKQRIFKTVLQGEVYSGSRK